MKNRISWHLTAGFASAATLVWINLGPLPVAAQTVFVANDGASGDAAYSILKFGADGVPNIFIPYSWGSQGVNWPHGVALDRSGNLYVGYWGGGTNFIRKFDPAGNGTLFAGLDPNFNPGGMALDQRGNLYVANDGNGTIERFSPAGADLGTFGNLAMQWPDTMAFDSQSNLFVADLSGQKILKFDLAGQGTVFASGEYFRGIALDGGDNVYASVGAHIDKFSTNGASLGTLALRAGEFAAEGLAFDANGNLFMSDYQHGTICRFDSQGNESTFAFITGTSDLEMLAVQSSPGVQLAIDANGHDIVLNWPVAATNYILQVSTNTLANWTDYAGTSVVTSGRCWVTNTASGDAVFYRLRQP